MKANAPEKIQVHLIKNNCDDWSIEGYSFLEDKQVGMTEYIRTDVFIEKACEYWYKYNRDVVNKRRCEFTVNVEDFRKYMKGE